MGKEEILNYLKNSKIQDETLIKICYYFSKDYNASQTANELNISRQTINAYYKIIRNLLLQKQDELTFAIKQEVSNHNCFFVKTIKSKSMTNYYIELNEKVLILNESKEFLPNIEEFVNKDINSSLQNNKKVNCARVLFNKKDNKYLVTKILKSKNIMEEFVQNRLKKFRGLNKDNILLHLKESQFRYNYSQEYLYTTLLKLLNLNTKTSAF